MWDGGWLKGDLDMPCWWQGGRGLGDDPRWWRPAGARDEHGAMTRGRVGAGKVKGGRGEGLPGFWRSPGSF